MTRKKYEDLEFQLMELETRCESELEQAEEHFRNEQKFVTQTAKMRQVKILFCFNNSSYFSRRILYVNLIINNI